MNNILKEYPEIKTTKIAVAQKDFIELLYFY